jgi:ferric-dicitrate binding protein FerR (iron transport regulator)
MEDLLDALLFDSAPDRREELEKRLDEDPALADAWAHWRRARREIRERLQAHLSDRRLLVLYVLRQDGHEHALTPEERAALDAAHEDLERALDEHPALRDVVERIREERADFEAAWDAYAPTVAVPSEEAAVREERDAERTDRAPRSPAAAATRWTRRLALAALVAVVAVASVWFWPGGPATTTVTVAEGTTRTVTIGDRATARVVGAATLSHPAERPEDGPWRVALQSGRVFFDVQSAADGRSFVVETPTATATVLGTQFGVLADHDTTEVVLASGTVRVGRPDGADAVELNPGEKSWVTTQGAPAGPTPADLTTALDWTGLFIFRSTPLSAIADRMSRHYEANVTVTDALADEPVTGTFEREQPVREVLDALAATLGAEVEQADGQYRLVPRP